MANDPAREFCVGEVERNSIEAIEIGDEKIWRELPGLVDHVAFRSVAGWNAAAAACCLGVIMNARSSPL